MNILYFLNFYPTKHKLVAHDEMLELARRGYRITAISVWGGLKDKAIYFDLTQKTQVLVISYLLLKYPVKIRFFTYLLTKIFVFLSIIDYE